MGTKERAIKTGGSNPQDTTLICKNCGRIEKVSFLDSMKNGWPVCHNEGMHLHDTEADIQSDLKKLTNFSYRSFSHTQKASKIK